MEKHCTIFWVPTLKGFTPTNKEGNIYRGSLVDPTQHWSISDLLTTETPLISLLLQNRKRRAWPHDIQNTSSSCLWRIKHEKFSNMRNGASESAIQNWHNLKTLGICSSFSCSCTYDISPLFLSTAPLYRWWIHPGW